ncbi:MAG: rane protein, partial [Candidatus Saccharibacteria bacterium]|nr:rane protein [Candidatus Saccharibacteria bacterium]
LGIFEVNGVHNVIHLVSGIAALLASKTYRYSKLYFQVFGIVYGLVTLLGIFSGDNAILGIVAHNVADIFLHLIITAAALYFGFGTPRNEAVASNS